MGLVLTLVGCGIGADLARGRSALDRGDLAVAEAAYRSALDRDATSVDALYGMGWTWHLAGQRDLARGAFQQLIAVHPESPLGYKGLGSLALAEGNAEAAREQFQKARDRAPGDVAIRHSLGLLALSAGDAEAALASFDALVEEAPDRTELHQARAEALLRLDRSTEALDASTLAVSTATEPRARVMAWLIRARCILAASARRVDERDCAGTAPAVYAWLDEADGLLDQAEATGLQVPGLPETRRAIQRRRGAVGDLCPGARTGTGAGASGRDFPDG